MSSDFDGCRDRWLAGLCPCCGMELNWHTRPSEVVAEGVMFCGRCIENSHHERPPEFLDLMLRALLPARVREP